ncbi:MAG: hypothetical protein LUF30_07410, partial [Lachnospiraceae bacterium]|nr:hypothetical protein [Lachnospiraceae bacterium]
LVLVREVKDESAQMGMFGPQEETEAETEEELALDFTEFVTDETKAQEYAADSDVAIIWISRQPGEGNNRYEEEGDWYLDEDELAALANSTKYFSKTIVVLN